MPAPRTPRSVRLLGFIALAAALWFSSIPASAEFRLERQFPLDPGGTFALDAAAGTVDVIGDSSSGVTVTVTSNRDDTDKRFDFVFDTTPQAVKLSIKRHTGFELFGEWLRGGLQITVHTPSDAMVETRTAGGSIEVSRVSSARLRTSGGSVHVDGIAGDVDAHTSGGSIHVRQVRGRASVETSGGGIE